MQRSKIYEFPYILGVWAKQYEATKEEKDYLKFSLEETKKEIRSFYTTNFKSFCIEEMQEEIRKVIFNPTKLQELILSIHCELESLGCCLIHTKDGKIKWLIKSANIPIWLRCHSKKNIHNEKENTF